MHRFYVHEACGGELQRMEYSDAKVPKNSEALRCARCCMIVARPADQIQTHDKQTHARSNSKGR